MTKENLDVIEWEAKVTKDGSKNYFRFRTDQGWMSCFDKTVIEELRKYIGKTVSCEVSESLDGQFRNIVGFNNAIQTMPRQPEIEVKQKVIDNSITPRRGDFPLSMQVSYAKDIFMHINSDKENYEADMNKAISLIKQAMIRFLD